MMNLHDLFIELITSFLDGSLDRQDVAQKITDELPPDFIKGNKNDLLPNCEWALRHINETEFWTTKRELEYYLSCLKGEKVYSSAERDKIITNEK